MWVWLPTHQVDIREELPPSAIYVYTFKPHPLVPLHDGGVVHMDVNIEAQDCQVTDKCCRCLRGRTTNDLPSAMKSNRRLTIITKGSLDACSTLV